MISFIVAIFYILDISHLQAQVLATYHYYLKPELLERIGHPPKMNDAEYIKMKDYLLDFYNNTYQLKYVWSCNDTVFIVDGPHVRDGKEFYHLPKDYQMKMILPKQQELYTINLPGKFGFKFKFSKGTPCTVLNESKMIDGKECRKAVWGPLTNPTQILFTEMDDLHYISPEFFNGITDVVIQYEDNASKCELIEIKNQKSFDLLPNYSGDIRWVDVKEYNMLNNPASVLIEK